VQTLLEMQNLPKEPSNGDSDEADSFDQPDDEAAVPQHTETKDPGNADPADPGANPADEDDGEPASGKQGIEAEIDAEAGLQDQNDDSEAPQDQPERQNLEGEDAAAPADDDPELEESVKAADHAAPDADESSAAAETGPVATASHSQPAQASTATPGESTPDAPHPVPAGLEQQADTLLDELLDDNLAIDDAELERRIVLMNKGMPK
jgi:hypothetical protein